MTGRAIILRADAANLPLPDESVDLLITSPPYWALRSYADGGEHYQGQLGSEASPREYLDALLACTRDWIRVLKPSGSMFINLGDKFSNPAGSGPRSLDRVPGGGGGKTSSQWQGGMLRRGTHGAPPKSLLGLPWRYALGCMDDLGLILRRDIIWSKPNGLPESVTDRCRSSHEYLFHLVRQPRYYAAVDEIREAHTGGSHGDRRLETGQSGSGIRHRTFHSHPDNFNSLGKLPGSVWEIASQPLTVPASLGIDHFAAFPMELPRRVILGWSPPGICTACGEGRRPVSHTPRAADHVPVAKHEGQAAARGGVGASSQLRLSGGPLQRWRARNPTVLFGYACECTPFHWQEDDTARWKVYHFDRWTPPPTRPATVLDPFGGTGTTALVAAMHGRTGISVDRSADYCRLARWRVTDPAERAKAMCVPKPPPVPDGQDALFDLEVS